MTAIVSLRHLSKRFGKVLALEDVSLDLNASEVVGLIGQNGSGKSTLLNSLGGLQEPDSGEIVVRGETVRLLSAVGAARHGIGMVHQEQSLILNLSVAENIFLDKPNPAKRRGWYSWPAMYEAARRHLDKIELDVSPKTIVEELSYAERQMVELAKVLAIEETVSGNLVVLFDEPTAILAPSEIDMLFRQIRRLRSRAAIVFVSHRTDEIMEICDRVVVMTLGRKVAERQTKQTHREELYHLLVGHEQAKIQPPTAAAQAKSAGQRDPMLSAESVSLPDRFKDVSLEVSKGEIVELAGVLGSGTGELCRALFGVEEGLSGKVTLAGAPIAPSSAADAIALGIGYVPSDRKAEGALKGRSILDNMVLTFGLDYGEMGIFVNRRKEEQAALKWMSRLKVLAQSPHDPIERLSGGNQQKVVLGKWLLSPNLRVLLLDHPTRGLDPGARDDLYDAVREAAGQGLAILFVGDTVEEILGVSHKVIVMRDGFVTARLNLSQSNRPTEEDIVAAML